jgi:hypothetical protein
MFSGLLDPIAHWTDLGEVGEWSSGDPLLTQKMQGGVIVGCIGVSLNGLLAQQARRFRE